MDFIKPHGIVDSMLASATFKLDVPPQYLVIRGMLAGTQAGHGTGKGLERIRACDRGKQ